MRMLQIKVPKREYFDDSKNEFIYYPECTLNLEHSLLSISKWEQNWKKPFLGKDPKTYEESIDYIRCMTINTNVNSNAYLGLTQGVFDKVSEYINDPMTATWFNEKNIGQGKGGRGQVVTSELIYYWMIALNIPFDPCQKWHLNRLLTLIKICEIKNSPSKKMKQKDVYAQQRALNAARKRNLGTNG